MSSFPLTYPVSPQPPPFCPSDCLTSRLLLVCLLSVFHPDYLLCLSPNNLSVSQSHGLPFCLPLCPYASCFVFLSACLPCLSSTLLFCTSDCLPFYLLVCLSVFVALHLDLLTLSVPNAAYLTTCQSACLTVCPLACLTDCLSIFVFFQTCLPNLSPSTPSVCLTAYLPRGFETDKIGLHEGRQKIYRQAEGRQLHILFFLSVLVCIGLKKRYL